MAYTIQLSEVGQSLYAKRDRNLEKAVTFLIERIGVEQWHQRRADIARRFGDRLEPDPATTPVEGISVRDRDDEIGWYIFLCETSIADPPATNSDQLSRVAPYLSAVGRKLGAIMKIVGVEDRLTDLLRRVKNQDPDQALFELLVGAAYVQEGWSVAAIPESGAAKTPDFKVSKKGLDYEVECKRLTRRAEYTTQERDAWLRLWMPVSQWLERRHFPWIFTVTFHVELIDLPQTYLLETIIRGGDAIARGETVKDGGRCTISAKRTDLAAITRHLEKDLVKVSCATERVLIGGRYERDYGFTYAVLGKAGSMGAREIPGNRYWEDITYAHGAFWRCDAPRALEKKARDIRKRLSEATEQLTGVIPGIVHIGIETAEGDDVELVRSQRILNTVHSFDPDGKPLHWILLHYFRGEAPADQDWVLDETIQRAGSRGRLDLPLKADFLVSPEHVKARDGAHWLN